MGMTLSKVVTRSKTLPDRIVMFGQPGWGKTSLCAGMPRPIFLMTPGEDRLKKLIEQGLVPPTAHFEEVAQEWQDVMAAVRELHRQQHDYQTFVIDTGNGAERLAQEDVCETQFGGDWGEGGFNAFARGEKITVNKLWVPFLSELDRLRQDRKMRIVLACHSIIRSTKNPEGQDYDKIEPGLSKLGWAFTAKWADMILCGSLDINIKKESKVARGKATGGKVRLLHTSASAAYDAKNVHRLPATINLGSDPMTMYAKFRAAFPARPMPLEKEPLAVADEPAPVIVAGEAEYHGDPEPDLPE